ncbi:MAG: hypothetical protein Q9159_004252 [Coniocarpon cinnabarinum]
MPLEDHAARDFANRVIPAFYADLSAHLAPLSGGSAPKVRPEHAYWLRPFYNAIARFARPQTPECAIKRDILANFNALNAERRALSPLKRLFMYGGGSFAKAEQAGDWETLNVRLTQLALLVVLAKTLNESMMRMATRRKVLLYAQDPEYTPQDVSFLQALHFSVSTSETSFNSQCGADSLFYAPHMEMMFRLQALIEWPILLLTDLGVPLSDHSRRRLKTRWGSKKLNDYGVQTLQAVRERYELRRSTALESVDNEPGSVPHLAFGDVRLQARRSSTT